MHVEHTVVLDAYLLVRSDLLHASHSHPLGARVKEHIRPDSVSTAVKTGEVAELPSPPQSKLREDSTTNTESSDQLRPFGEYQGTLAVVTIMRYFSPAREKPSRTDG